MQPRVAAKHLHRAVEPENAAAPPSPTPAAIRPMPASGAQHDCGDRGKLSDFEQAQQRSDADYSEHEDHEANDEDGQRDGEQQWQQEQNVDRGQSAKRQQRGRGIAKAVVIFPAAQPGFGAQFPRQSPRLAERGRNILLASPRRMSFIEIGGVVGDDIVDLPRRKPGEPIAENRQEGDAVHSGSPSNWLTASVNARHSRFCAAKAARPLDVRR